MTKPIEWTREVKSTETTLIRTRLAVQQMDRYGSTIAVLAATPADLVAALAAMGDGERAEVLGAALPDERVARREWVDETRVIIRALPTESIQDAARRVVRERDEEREALRRAHELCADVTQKRIQEERERDEARTERGITADAFRAATDRADAAMRAERTACERAEKAERERDEAVALQDVAVNRLAALELERDEALAKLRASYQTEADNDSILLHRIALSTAERDSALAQLKDRDDELSRLRAQPPRSYPLAEGSRWIENVIRSADGSQSWLAGGQVVTDGPLTSGLRYTYRQSARDLAALLAKGGLL